MYAAWGGIGGCYCDDILAMHKIIPREFNIAPYERWLERFVDSSQDARVGETQWRAPHIVEQQRYTATKDGEITIAIHG